MPLDVYFSDSKKKNEEKSSLKIESLLSGSILEKLNFSIIFFYHAYLAGIPFQSGGNIKSWNDICGLLNFL
jgi:hypothetical protein